MSAILALRMLGALLLFVLLARKVPVEDFGRFSACYGIGAVLAVFVDFGFNQSLLRDISKVPEAAKHYVGEGITLKLVISVLVLLASAVYLVGYSQSSTSFALQFSLILYFIVNSFCEFFGTALRATGDYVREAGAQAFFTIALIAIAVAFPPRVLEIASAMLALATARLALMHGMARSRIGPIPLDFSAGSIASSARRGSPYALDQGVGNLATNADILFVAYALGPVATGIYQAGQKVVQGMSASALVFSNVYLPRLSKLRPSDIEFRRTSIKVALLMGAAASACFVLLFFFGSQLTDHVYGTNFEPLKPLLPLFAILIFIRYVNAIMGLHLTALGTQRLRAMVNIACLVVFLASCAFFIQKFALAGVIYSLIAAAVVQTVLYGYGALRAMRISI